MNDNMQPSTGENNEQSGTARTHILPKHCIETMDTAKISQAPHVGDCYIVADCLDSVVTRSVSLAADVSEQNRVIDEDCLLGGVDEEIDDAELTESEDLMLLLEDDDSTAEERDKIRSDATSNEDNQSNALKGENAEPDVKMNNNSNASADSREEVTPYFRNSALGDTTSDALVDPKVALTDPRDQDMDEKSSRDTATPVEELIDDDVPVDEPELFDASSNDVSDENDAQFGGTDFEKTDSISSSEKRIENSSINFDASSNDVCDKKDTYFERIDSEKTDFVSLGDRAVLETHDFNCAKSVSKSASNCSDISETAHILVEQERQLMSKEPTNKLPFDSHKTSFHNSNNCAGENMLLIYSVISEIITNVVDVEKHTKENKRVIDDEFPECFGEVSVINKAKLSRVRPKMVDTAVSTEGIDDDPILISDSDDEVDVPSMPTLATNEVPLTEKPLQSDKSTDAHKFNKRKLIEFDSSAFESKKSKIVHSNHVETDDIIVERICENGRKEEVRPKLPIQFPVNDMSHLSPSSVKITDGSFLRGHTGDNGLKAGIKVSTKKLKQLLIAHMDEYLKKHHQSQIVQLKGKILKLEREIIRWQTKASNLSKELIDSKTAMACHGVRPQDDRRSGLRNIAPKKEYRHVSLQVNMERVLASQVRTVVTTRTISNYAMPSQTKPSPIPSTVTPKLQDEQSRHSNPVAAATARNIMQRAAAQSNLAVNSNLPPQNSIRMNIPKPATRPIFSQPVNTNHSRPAPRILLQSKSGASSQAVPQSQPQPSRQMAPLAPKPGVRQPIIDLTDEDTSKVSSLYSTVSTSLSLVPSSQVTQPTIRQPNIGGVVARVPTGVTTLRAAGPAPPQFVVLQPTRQATPNIVSSVPQGSANKTYILSPTGQIIPNNFVVQPTPQNQPPSSQLLSVRQTVPVQVPNMAVRPPIASTISTPSNQALLLQQRLPVSSLSLQLSKPEHPAPLPPPEPGAKVILHKPWLTITKITSGLVISWDMHMQSTQAEIASYQLFAYQEGNQPPHTSLWKKISDVKALPLPMACTLTQFSENNTYHFAVRAVDSQGRIGPFSDPRSVLYC